MGGRELGLPEPNRSLAIAGLLAKRRSRRRFERRPIALWQLSTLLWAAYGFVEGRRRAVPSAGAVYPLEIYVAAGEGGVEGLGAGVYRYEPPRHALGLVREGDVREALYDACLRQSWVREAPAALVVLGDPGKISAWYGERGVTYMILEAGHVGQNIYLAAAEMGLGTVAIGAFDDDAVREAVGAGPGLMPLYVFPVGHPK